VDVPPGGPFRWHAAALDTGDALYLPARDGRVYRMRWPDGAWEQVLAKIEADLVGIVTDPGRKDRRIAAFLDGRLEISKDGGRTWSPLGKPGRFADVDGIATGPDRRLHLAADGAVRTLDLATLD